MTVAIKYHAYGANGIAIKDGTILVSSLDKDDDLLAGEMIEAVAEDVGEDEFEAKVVGVKYG